MKNTKIMAVLVVLLAAMLFVGAASAYPVSSGLNLTADNGKYYLQDGDAFNVSITVAGDIGQENLTKISDSLVVNYGGTDYKFGAWTVSNGNNVSNVTLTAKYGIEQIVSIIQTNSNIAITDLTSPFNLVVSRNVTAGNLNAFVYETIFIGDGAASITLRNNESGLVNSIPADSHGNVELFFGSVGEKYGEYEIVGGSAAGKTVNIWYPEMTLIAYLEGTTDSIDGKTVGKLDKVSFYVEAPKVATTDGLNAKVTIWFTTTVGGKTSVYGVDYASKVPLSQARQLIGTSAAGDTIAAGTYTAYAEFQTPKSFKDYADKSNTITFTVQSTSLSITAAQDSVVRSNPFSVTISGAANTPYKVYITNPDDDGNSPSLQEGQSGWQSDIANGAVFKTDASGKRTIQFNTDANTEDKSYTIRVEETGENPDWDEVKVKVEKGAVTMSASGDGSYYIGEEITLSGTNSDSSQVFLFITGPNLKTNGEVLKSLPNHVDAYLATNPVSVKTDNTWEYKWDTSGCGLDTGAYTIYATSTLTNGKASDPATDANGDTIADKLSDSEYATVSVNLKQPFLSAVPSGTVVAKGDKIYIRGTAEGDPSTLMLYIFGPNKYLRESITVEDDGTYEKKLDIGSDWSSNQYFVVIEHPMYNGDIDVNQVYYDKNNNIVDSKANTAYSYTTLEIKNFGNQTNVGLQGSFVVEGTNKLQGSNAADALTKMIDSANIDDIYTKLTFTVAEPWIKIENPGDQAVDSKFTITGTTNLAVDDQILVEVVSSSFNAVDKTSTSTTSGISMTTKVVAGEGTDNVWSVEVDTTNWKLDEYTIKASGIEVDVSTTTNFNVVEKVEVTPTATATGATPTTTATATATTAPTQTPGFGAFVALAGLGAVALLVLRRN